MRVFPTGTLLDDGVKGRTLLQAAAAAGGGGAAAGEKLFE